MNSCFLASLQLCESPLLCPASGEDSTIQARTGSGCFSFRITPALQVILRGRGRAAEKQVLGNR